MRCILPTLPHLAELLHPAFLQGSGADPTLVIDLLSSLPGSIETSTVDDNGRTKWMNLWNSQDEAHQEELRRADQKLDNFMSEVIPLQALTSHISIVHLVLSPAFLRCPHTRSSSQVIIPKAVASNAIVICDGLKGACLLSDSLNRVMAFQVTFSTLYSLTLPPLCLP